MPLAVLVEVLLQPCGWLASYLGFAARRANDALFRNLDGKNARIERAVTPDSGTLRVTAQLERFAEAGGSTIVFFSVVCADAQGPLMTLDTDFGFFEPAALAAQVGLPLTPEQAAGWAAPSPREPISLLAPPPLLRAAVGSARLCLLDEITGYWPSAPGVLPRIRGRHRVDPAAWYFKAHFFQDPVQPGSLGLETLLRLACCLARLEGPELVEPSFELEMSEEPLAWRFRGQVTPAQREVVTEVEALALEHGPGFVRLRANASLWVDGLCIYQVTQLSLSARAQGKGQ
jgi:3-hydroxymyristoyl/3-hydroxydecanoyl-(acyl carrier protein) dehydratase